MMTQQGKLEEKSFVKSVLIPSLLNLLLHLSIMC